MVNEQDDRRPTAAPASQLAGPRCIGTEQDAIEAFGEGSDLHLWAREFLRQPRSCPVTLTPADDAAATAAVRIAGLRLAGPGPALHALSLEYDPQRSPQLRCTVDGKRIPLEQTSDGWWRPKLPRRSRRRRADG